MSDLLEKNLGMLSRFQPSLARRMAAFPWPKDGYSTASSRSGAATLKVRGHDGIEVRLHSEYDPVKEAGQFLKAKDLAPFDAYGLNGFGLGYVALDLVHRVEPRRWLAFIEADEGLFRVALESVDLSPLLTRGRVRFFVGQEWVPFQKWLRDFFICSGALNFQLLGYPPCERIFPSFYQDVKKEVEAAANARRVMMNTAVLRGEVVDRNYIRNLAEFPKCAGSKDFEGQFADVPAIVIAAGPSLDAATPLLRKAKGRSLIVCADRALKPVLKARVVPDFVVAIDMNPLEAEMFRGFDVPEDLTLVFDPDCYHEVPAEFSGARVSYLSGSGLSEWSRPFLGDRGMLEKGGSVVHSAFTFARATGADPVLLVGADLSYPTESTHADGVVMVDSGKVADQRVTLELVPSVNGGEVRTSASLKSFITYFEMIVASSQSRVVQTSEMGALIRGAEHLPLKEALERYARAEVNVSGRIRSILAKTPDFEKGVFARLSGRTLEDMQFILDAASEGLRVARRLKRLDPSNRLNAKDINRQIRQVQELRAKVLSKPDAEALLERTLTASSVEKKSLLIESEALSPDDPERARLAFQEHEVFFEGYVDAASHFIREMKSVREKLLESHGEGASADH